MDRAALVSCRAQLIDLLKPGSRSHRSLRIEREPGVLPRIEPAVKWVHVFPTAFGEFLCHTGTRSLVRSSAISDDCAIVRDLGEMLCHLVRGYPDRGRQFLISLAPCLRIPRIDKSELFPSV